MRLEHSAFRFHAQHVHCIVSIVCILRNIQLKYSLYSSVSAGRSHAMVNFLHVIEAAMHLDGEIDANQDSKLALLLPSSMSYHYTSDLVIFDLVHMTIHASSHSPIVVTASRTRTRMMGSPHARPVHPASPRFSMPACKARHDAVEWGIRTPASRFPTSPEGRLGSCKCSEREPSHPHIIMFIMFYCHYRKGSSIIPDLWEHP